MQLVQGIFKYVNKMKIEIKTTTDLQRVNKLFPNGHIKNYGKKSYWVFKINQSERGNENE